MTTLVFVTQLLDEHDPDLGFVVRQLDVLATHVDRLVVIANEVRGAPTRHERFEVVSLGKESGRGTTARGARYVRTLVDLERVARPTALVAHMCPVYLNLAAPLARLRRTPTLLWFVNSADRPSLRIATRLASAVITALPGSAPVEGDKVHVIGHAIETDAFPSTPLVRGTSLRLLALGRTSPDKGYPDIIEAVRIARQHGASVTLRIAGPSMIPTEVAHRAELHELISAKGLEDVVALEGPIDRREVPAAIRDADVLVNAMAEHAADKVVFEAMASGRPVVVVNAVFDPLLRASPVALRPDGRRPEDIAERIVALDRLPGDELAAIGTKLRDAVVAEHSLEHWAAQVVELAEQLATRP